MIQSANLRRVTFWAHDEIVGYAKRIQNEYRLFEVRRRAAMQIFSHMKQQKSIN